jgi:hypothetical protein
VSESYRFSPRPRGTIVGPLALRHIVGLGLVALFSIGLIVLWPSYVTAAIAMAVVAIMVLALWFPVLNGMTVADLVPHLLLFTRDSVTGRRDWRSGGPFGGTRDRLQVLGRVPPPLDRAGIRLLGGRDLGIVEDTKRQTWTALLRISGQAFDLLTAERQEALADGWMTLLADYCRSGDYVTRLQWVTRSVPDGGEAHQAWLKSAGAEPDEEYEQLLTQHSTDTMRHEFYMAVTISLRRADDAVRGAWNMQQARERLLLETLTDLADKLSSTGVSVDGYLGAADLTAVIRRGYVPDTADRHTNEAQQLRPEQAWPVAIEAQWDYVRVDDAFHAVYWVDEYPRIDVGLGFLSPLLAATGVRRTVAMILQPMDLTTSQREAEASLVAQMSARKEREQRGFLTTAAQEAELASTARREREIAVGYGEYQFATFLVVSAFWQGHLARDCAKVEALARRSKLQVVRMYGQQAAGLAFSLPIGLGLKDRGRIRAL